MVAIIIWILCLAGAIAVAVAGFESAGEYLPSVALFAFIGWAGLWRPSIKVDDSAVTLVNVLSSVQIPWPAIIQIDTRYALTVVTPNHKFPATAAPAPGRLTTVFSRKEVGRANSQVGSDGRIRPSDLPHTDSGAAAMIIRNKWERLQKEDRIEIGVADETPVTRIWHSTTIVAGCLLAALAIVALLYG
ncbi:MAG: PH domain-containing protein [Cryobacterium sp.]|nr:PH domain-containing protein [Cryobacterium sp.]